MHRILPISERGQITIPKKVRDEIKVKFFTWTVEEGRLVLKPLKTRDEFVEELEEAEKNWEKRGGLTISEMKKKYKLSK